MRFVNVYSPVGLYTFCFLCITNRDTFKTPCRKYGHSWAFHCGSTLPLFFVFVRFWSNKFNKLSGWYVMCCVIPTLLEYLAANSGINEIWFAKAAFYLWQWSMLWWGTKWKAWTTFCVISSVSRCGKNFLYKRNQSTSYICTLPFSHKPKLSTSVFSALTAIILESWIRSLLQRSIRAFRAIAPSSYDHCTMRLPMSIDISEVLKSKHSFHAHFK